MSLVLGEVEMNQGLTSSIEERALKLLGSGASAEQTASALGISASRISQLLADTTFSSQVSELKCSALLEHTARDNKLDTLEDRLVEKIEGLIPLIMRPMEAIRSFQIINAAKRRAQIITDPSIVSANIVQISMPQTIINRFTTNINNQVVQAAGQELLTIQSGALLKQVQSENPQLVALNQPRVPIGALHHEYARERVGPDEGNNDARRENNSIASQQEASRLPAALHFIPVGG
jgi:hypothetical protein